ncbi:MAG: UDP-N-acetylmuramoyl-tripeptide--D-alanyl-D-alanine ligase [Chthoniobacterales bacterium]
MTPLPLSQLAEWSGGTLSAPKAEASVSRLSTDSRTLRPGELFVALRGDNFDGHHFLDDAAKRGAVGALINTSWNGTTPNALGLIRVADTLVSYQQIAAAYRQTLALKVIAITGSNGKTSTKDFTAAVLASRFRVTKTEGNLNNHVGLPRTMLEATSSDEIAVWEIGMNHAGEVAALAKLAAPDIAIITNVGIAHIEFFGSREAIAIEKGALVETLTAEGTAILNADDPFSASIAKRTAAKVVLVGLNSGLVRAENIRQTAEGSQFTIVEDSGRCGARLPVPGLHMVQNAILAVAAGRVLGLSLEECAAGLMAAPLTKSRLQIKSVRGRRFIDDSYNANPDSMKAALLTLTEIEVAGRRIAVLGEMSELGAESERGHREVGEAAAKLRIDLLITIGETAAAMARAAQSAGLKNAVALGSAEGAAEFLAKNAGPDDVVLVKGSRTARTERVLDEFAKLHPVGRTAR